MNLEKKCPEKTYQTEFRYPIFTWILYHGLGKEFKQKSVSIDKEVAYGIYPISKDCLKISFDKRVSGIALLSATDELIHIRINEVI